MPTERLLRVGRPRSMEEKESVGRGDQSDIEFVVSSGQRLKTLVETLSAGPEISLSRDEIFAQFRGLK